MPLAWLFSNLRFDCCKVVALIRTIPYGFYYLLNWSIRLRIEDISNCSISLATLQYFSLLKRYCSISPADVCCCFSWLYFALPGGANSESQHARNSLCAVLLSNSEYFFQTIFTREYFESFQNTFMNTSLKSKHAKF